MDCNFGCPIDVVCGRGGGAACLLRPRHMEQIVRSMSSILSCPVTFKMRKVRAMNYKGESYVPRGAALLRPAAAATRCVGAPHASTGCCNKLWFHPWSVHSCLQCRATTMARTLLTPSCPRPRPGAPAPSPCTAAPATSATPSESKNGKEPSGRCGWGRDGGQH